MVEPWAAKGQGGYLPPKAPPNGEPRV